VTDTATHPEFETEQAFLAHAAACLDEMREKARRTGDAGGDKKSSAALAQEKAKFLERLNDPESILIGRLDSDDGVTHYIGPRPIWNAEQKLVAISWAAPAAEPFYEAGPTNTLGIRLRRRLQTERRKLLGIADELFGEGVSEPTLDDVLLSDLERERTGEMREVVATIQRDQYAIVKRPYDEPTVVQGGPGTGKTVVGLHRAALLLFRHRAELAAQRVLIIGPNKVFMQYIAYVLPSLGETAVVQLTPEGFASEDVRIADVDERLVALVKGDERMAEVLARAVADRVRPPESQLTFTANGIDFAVSAEAVRTLIREHQTAGQSYRSARLQFRGALERLVEAAYADAYRTARPGLAPTAISGRRLPEFERALDRIWPTISAADLTRQFLSSEDRIERAAQGILTETERKLLHRKPVERLEDVRWTQADVPLVDEVESLMGEPIRKYGHVVVDEAQDLTPMQLRMVGRRVNGGAVTVLGDLAQGTGLWSYPTWSEVMDHLLGGERQVAVSELTHAYRVPREIMNAALPVLQLTAPSIAPPKPYRDGGSVPRFVSAARERRAATIVDQALEVDGGGGTVSIIAAPSLLPAVKRNLEERGIAFADAEHGELGSSLEVLDPVGSKGLEFDHVIIGEPAAIIREADGQGQRDLYVALTRATRTLTCVHSEPLPWPLGDHPTEPAPSTSGVTASHSDSAHGAAGGAQVHLTLGEAIALAKLRGLDVQEMLARVLAASAAGATEDDLVRAALDPTVVPVGATNTVLEAARGLRRENGS